MRTRYVETVPVPISDDHLAGSRTDQLAPVAGTATKAPIPHSHKDLIEGPCWAALPPTARVRIHETLGRRLQRYSRHPRYSRYRRYWQGRWKSRSFEVGRYRPLTEKQGEALAREALKYLNVKFPQAHPALPSR